MNLDDYDFESGVTVRIHNPTTGALTDAEIQLKSPHSLDSKRAFEETQREFMSKEPAKTEAEKEARRLEFLASYYVRVITGWSGIKEAGEEIECTKDEINRLLTTKRYYFVIDQLEQKSGKGGFNPKSLNDSTNGQDSEVGTKAKSK